MGNQSGLATDEIKQILKAEDFDFDAMHINPNATDPGKRDGEIPEEREL